MRYNKPLYNIMKNVLEGNIGLEYLCFEYKNPKGVLLSSHTMIELRNVDDDVVPDVKKDGYMVLSPNRNSQVVLSFSISVETIEENVLIFDDGSALVIYTTTEPDIESLYGDED